MKSGSEDMKETKLLTIKSEGLNIIESMSMNDMKQKIEVSRKEIESLWKKIKKIESRIYLQKTRVKLRNEILERLGNKCTICDWTDKRALQIDHIHGGGNKDIAGRGRSLDYLIRLSKLSDKELRENYQLLCANHNWIKRTENKESTKLSPKQIEQLKEQLKTLRKRKSLLVKSIKQEKVRQLKETIEKLYYKDNLTDMEIAKILGYKTSATISYKRKQLNIPTKSRRKYLKKNERRK